MHGVSGNLDPRQSDRITNWIAGKHPIRAGHLLEPNGGTVEEWLKRRFSDSADLDFI
jgi:hypothetical protein